MSAEPALSNGTHLKSASRPAVRLSLWVNERCPPLTELLSAHDVARLTRLIGRFPKRISYRGRRLGWCRTVVLDWMTRELALDQERDASRLCKHRAPRQACLPLKYKRRGPARRHTGAIR